MGFYQGNISRILSNALSPIIKEGVTEATANNDNGPLIYFSDRYTNNEDNNSDNNNKYSTSNDNNNVFNDCDPDIVLSSADGYFVYKISGTTGNTTTLLILISILIMLLIRSPCFYRC